jgi:SOS regulatory protein LexA
MLTEKQKIFFEKLKALYGKGALPSFEIIAARFGFKHKNSVWQYFNKLKEVDLVREINHRFFINPDLFGAVMFSTPVKAGFPSPAEDAVEKRVSLDSEFKIDSPSTFMFTVKGDSMIDAGIFEGDMVIVKRKSDPMSGDIVLASVDGEYTLKIFRKKGNDVYLEPANKNYEIIRAREAMEIFGVITGSIRSFKST